MNTFVSILCHDILYILQCSEHSTLEMEQLLYHFDTAGGGGGEREKEEEEESICTLQKQSARERE